MTNTSEQVLLVNVRDPEESRVALASHGRLLELRWSRTDRRSQVGNIYLATVSQVEPGLDAAFVDYGGARAGFLHLGNVHPGYADPDITPFGVASTPSDAAQHAVEGEAPSRRRPGKGDSIQDYLKPGQQILVQVQRDPVRGKGATLTTFLSMAGRLMVLMPSLGRVGVSRRIRDEEERERLREALHAVEPGEGIGVIARTAAADAGKRDLKRDLQHLMRRWEEIGKTAMNTDGGVGLLAEEESAPVRAVRDLYSPDVTRVIVDDESVADRVQHFLGEYVPRAKVEVERYSNRRPLFEVFDVERDYQLLFRPRVPYGEGASIVINETEALTAIDVNSGRIDKGSLEATALEANLLAAEEVARQIRLRDLGGIIVVDFIDMVDTDNRKQVESAFRKELRRDRARQKPGRLAAFGLMPLTRRRQGTGLPRATEWNCRHCAGTGTTTGHQAGALRVLRRLRAAEPGSQWRLRAHPGVLDTLAAHHSEVLAGLEIELESIPDTQVPAGEPVLDALSAQP